MEIFYTRFTREEADPQESSAKVCTPRQPWDSDLLGHELCQPGRLRDSVPVAKAAPGGSWDCSGRQGGDPGRPWSRMGLSSWSVDGERKEAPSPKALLTTTLEDEVRNQ